jgi:DNA invertase Pin-like site-specific DNA recombinase
MGFTVRGYGRASRDHQILSTSQQESVVRDAFDSFRRIKPKWSDAEWGGFFPDGAEESACRESIFRQRHFGSLILAASKPGDVILVSNYDRIFANVVDVCESLPLLSEMKVGLIVLDCDIDTTTIVGEFCFKILALVKEMEVKEIRRRTRESIAYRKRAGLPLGGRPTIGWMHTVFSQPGITTPQRRLVPDHAARRLAAELLRIKQSHKLSLHQASQFCNSLGLKQTNGRRWTPPTFAAWCRAAENNFPLPNGSHTPCPIPANAKPLTFATISAAD